MKTISELKKIVKNSKKGTKAVYREFEKYITKEVKRLYAAGKADEDGYIHVEDAELYEADAEYVQGEWDGQMMEWIYVDKDGLNFGNGYGDWTIEDFDLDDLIEFVEYLAEE